ncbi:hypothetical protein [Methanoplanus limicola]|uniref:Uncharacterized protein n=1 Tax=Methanoplanus limicola DSM 2279 TaxID=937775 RepID=H1YYQ7_9EURY|nr:hypothetical protein [Methanoplanus limicola]EHQ36040.1 hypothetical protein Metlim_1951 [Methanoplanus limicola DSM 2279]
MKRVLPILLLIIVGCAVAVSGCTSDSEPIADTQPVITAPPTEFQTPAPTEAVPAVTEPIIVKDEDIYSVKVTLNAEEMTDNNLALSVNYDYSNPFGATGEGINLLATLFAYNYDDVPAGFNPTTKAEIIAAGIPYKTVGETLYPNNVKKTGTELPAESTQGALNLAKPYNYGVIVDEGNPRN